MIACNCCPTPSGCKEHDKCLNAEVVQRSAKNWPFPIWVNGMQVPMKAHSGPLVYEPSTPLPAVSWAPVKPACWHSYAEREPSPIVEPRPCIYCGQPEF